jgi:HEPN domain-containing protein
LADVSEQQRRQAGRWTRQAAHDLADGRYAAEGSRHALSCFLSHQAAEKAVVGYLYARGAEQVWGHALSDLCEDAMALDPSFDLVKSNAALLDKHYLGARYPSTLPGGVPAEAYDEHDSARALAIAEEVLRFVSDRLEAEGLPPAGERSDG